MAKGPMTVTGFICYAQGWGGLYIRANKIAWKQIDRHPGLGIENKFESQIALNASIGRTNSRRKSGHPAHMITDLSDVRG